MKQIDRTFLQAPALLTKLLDKEPYRDNFIHIGELHFEPLTEWRNSKEEGRADEHEGLYEIRNGDDTADYQIKVGSEWQKIKASQERIWHSHYSDLASISFFAPKSFPFELDHRMPEQFGKYAIVAKSASKFITHLLDKLNALGIYPILDYVNYVDLSKHNGFVGALVKDVKYQYQQELRLVISKSHLDKTGNVHIGDLSDLVNPASAIIL